MGVRSYLGGTQVLRSKKMVVVARNLQFPTVPFSFLLCYWYLFFRPLIATCFGSSSLSFPFLSFPFLPYPLLFTTPPSPLLRSKASKDLAPHELNGGFPSCECLELGGSLSHKHFHPTHATFPARPGLLKQLGFKRVVDGVETHVEFTHDASGKGGGVHVWTHPHGRCVDKHVRREPWSEP